MRNYQLSDYFDYLRLHSQLHLRSRLVHMNTYRRLNSETDIATLQSQIDELRNVVCGNVAATA
jgi:hypothetical protein